MSHKKGFTIIEILISMLILFTTVVFVNMTIKAYNRYQRKSKEYQNFYITTLSIKDWLHQKDFSKEHYKGKMNGIEFDAKVKLLIKKKNYITSLEGFNGNLGNYIISLYEVQLALKDGTREREFKYFVTKQKAIYNMNKEKVF